jgi:phosphatidylserine decarboxylase
LAAASSADFPAPASPARNLFPGNHRVRSSRRPAAIPDPQAGPDRARRQVRQRAGGRADDPLHSLVRRALRRRHERSGRSRHRRLRSFNEFFTRPLRAGARPLAPADFICPVDGAISQFGAIERDQIFQAKGHRYSTAALVGGDRELAARFANGGFATLYLSPRDYHRIHMPCDGRLTRMIHVPGALFSVNPVTARGVPGLFARNERVVCVFESAHGPFVLALVGATIVGSMATVWHGVVNPPRPGHVREWNYGDRPADLRQGDEMGRFLLGSTVVMLFPPGVVDFNPDWAPARPVRLGEAMGTRLTQ